MPEDLTPEHMRCAIGASCSSVHQLEDGRYLIVGASAEYIGRRASIEDENRIQDYGPGNSYADDQIVWQAYRSPKIAIGPGETAIVISPDLLSSLPELVRLREENKRLREVLKPFDRYLEHYSPSEPDNTIVAWSGANPRIELGDLRHARSALSSDGGELVQQRGASDSPQCDHPVAEQVHEGEMKIPGAQHYEHIRGEFIYGVGMVYTRVDGSHAEACRCRWCAEAVLNASATPSGDRTASLPESPGLNHTSSDGGEG